MSKKYAPPTSMTEVDGAHLFCSIDLTTQEYTFQRTLSSRTDTVKPHFFCERTRNDYVTFQRVIPICPKSNT